MAILDSDDFIGIDPAPVSFTIKSSSTHPMVLGNDIRGTLHSILDSDKMLTDIGRRRLEEGMIAYIKTGYTETEDSIVYTYNSNTYYSYRVQPGDDVRTDANAGALPNSNLNWVKVDIEADDGKIYLQVDSDLPTETGTYVLTYNATTKTFKIVTHDSEHDSDVSLNDIQVWSSVSNAGPNDIMYEDDVIFGSAIASDQIESEHIKSDVIYASHIDHDFLETIITTKGEITGIIDSEGYVGGIANRLRLGPTSSGTLLSITASDPENDQVLVYDSSGTTDLVWRPRDNVQVETVHGHFVSSGDVELSFIPDDSDSDNESEIELNLQAIYTAATVGSSTTIPVITTNAKGLVTSITESDIDLAVIKDSDITFDSENITIRTADSEIVIPRYTDAKVSTVIDSEFDITTSSIRYLNTTFNKFTADEARTAVGIVTADITNSRQLIFSTSNNVRTLEQFRDSENATPENIRTADFVDNATDGTRKLTLVLVRFMPSDIDTFGIGGSQLAWDIPAIGTQTFTSPGVGIEVDVDGDTQLTDSGDPYISAIASISVNSGGGEVTDISTFTTAFGGGDPAADNANYQIRAIVEANASIKPTVSNIQSTDGGTAVGTITLSQSDGTTTSDYTAESDNDLEWDLSWQNVGVDISTTLNGYDLTTGKTFLKTQTYSNIDYSSEPTGLSNITSTAATGVAVSVASPDSDYIYLTVESSSNGVLTGGEVVFDNPVDTETTRAATVNIVTSFTRPAAVTTNGEYSLSITSPFTLLEPVFTYPRFFIITDRADDPDLADIIDDSTTTGIAINIESDDSAVTGDIASLNNDWIGTGSTGSITITSGQPTSTIWFALPSDITQPTNFERRGFVGFDVLENVHGLRGVRSDSVLEDLVPDDISGFNTNYDGHEYRFYGIDIGGGETIIRIY